MIPDDIVRRYGEVLIAEGRIGWSTAVASGHLGIGPPLDQLLQDAARLRFAKG